MAHPHSIKPKIDAKNIPAHVAIIMDGNGRWAKQRGATRLFGHRNAIRAVREVTEGCAELGVKRLSLYAFSTENWGRPRREVDGLMLLLVSTLKKEIPTLLKNNIRLQPIGAIEQLPSETRKNLLKGIEQTKENTGMTLALALNYGSRREISLAIHKLMQQVKNKEVNPDGVDDAFICNYLDQETGPDVELMIRTSGEYRMSNFLLWQAAYAEFYFTETLWPDFKKEDLYEAILSFQKRERRYGKTSEQVAQHKGKAPLL